MRKLRLGLCPLAILAASSVQAQWVQQVIDLQPGWNAVHLNLDPTPDTIDEALAETRVNRDGMVDSVDGVILFNWHLGNIRYLPL